MIFYGRPTAILTVESVTLGADIWLEFQNSYVDVVTTPALGAEGQNWLIIANALLTSTTDDFFQVEIYDGTTAVAATTVSLAANAYLQVPLHAYVSLPSARAFALRIADISTPNGYVYAGGTTPTATRITAIRMS